MDIKISLDKRADRVLESLSAIDKGRVRGYIKLFKENGFGVPPKYLKKIESNLWELRPGNTRILFGMVGEVAIIVNIFKKKTRKTPLKEIETARNRLKEYR
ncbi:type II toxin-antitoxin system RelE/ParE family toxin [Candidatus Microgenomates bacterium]|nr:type II toxin-antitoxin system RelE/ParE family toxin [Candidatus Microgenomates bacterium]